jgi:ATP-dependent helicase/nuclease subunit A
MSENFRCDRGIIDFVNLVCGEIFKAFAESIGYDEENDNLRFGKISASFDPPKKAIINFIEPPQKNEEEGDGDEEPEVDENEDKLYAEAVICANEIARLIRDKNEKNADGSPVRAGDIAILVRGHSQIIPLSEALNKIGIKYVTNAKNRLLDSDEMKLLMDVLTVIDNPREDIPLCRVLSASLPVYSPLMTLDDVVAVRCASGNKLSLFDALISYGKNGENEALRESCKAVVSLFDSFRVLSTRVSADKLLRALSRSDAFAALCETDAFTYLYSNACKYVKSSWNGLYSFNTYFKGLMEKGGGASEPISAQEDEVTIITMHQSKGLEYKVCFLFGLGKSFNMKDLTNPIIFNRELGFSMKLPQKRDEDGDILSGTQMTREENILWRTASLLSKNKLLEEEARIFYVALTRAKERLYLSATLNKSYEELRASLTEGGSCDVASAIRSGKSYAFWTIVALLNSTVSDGLFEINTVQKTEIPPLADRITREEVESSAYGITEEDKKFADTLNRPHGESESEKLLSLIPAKVAASKVSPTMLDDSVFIPAPTGILFTESDEDKSEDTPDSSMQIKRRISLMRSQRTDFDSLLEVNKKPTAAERGSAAHLILQHCDYERVTELGLDAEIERLVSEKFITRRTADIVKRDQLAGFFESSLFALAKNAKMTRREFHFGMFRSAADFTANEELKSSISEKKIFVQGSIDLLIETEDGIILCDYKTDRVSTEEKADRALLEKNMRERHAAQLEEYRFAVKEIFGKEPCKVYIYSIPLGEVIEMQ